MSAYNFLGLVNDVNRRANEVELTSATFANALGFYTAVKDGVNAAIYDINQQQFEWPFNHVKKSEALVAGTVRYNIPSDAKTLDMDSFRIARDDALGNETKKLEIISYEEYLDKYLDYEYNTATGVRTLPRFVFRTPSLEYGVVPSPDKAYPIKYEYYRSITPLDLYSDVPSVPQDFRHIIVDGAMVYASAFLSDNESSQLSQRKFDDGIKAMRTLYINRYEYIRSTVRTR
jgi:hypothetical protein